MSRTARRIALAIAVGALAFAALSVYGDVHALGDRLRRFRWSAFAAALALALVNYGVRLARWNAYLRAKAIAVPPRRSALIFLSGFALAVTPGKVGELIKSYLLRQTDGVPMTRSVPIVIAERVTDLVALVALAVAGAGVYGVAGRAVAGAAGAIGFGLLLLAWPRLGLGAIRVVSRPRRLRRLGARLREVYLGLADLTRPSRLWWSTGLGVVAWAAECVGFAVILAGFTGVRVSLGLATTIYAATTIAGALSFLPAGLVVTETAMTLLLVQLGDGLDEPTAVAATMLTRLATLWFAVAIGAAALAALRREAGVDVDGGSAS